MPGRGHAQPYDVLEVFGKLQVAPEDLEAAHDVMFRTVRLSMPHDGAGGGSHHHAALSIEAYGFLMAKRSVAGKSVGGKNFIVRQVPAIPEDYIPRGSPARAAARGDLDHTLRRRLPAPPRSIGLVEPRGSGCVIDLVENPLDSDFELADHSVIQSFSHSVIQSFSHSAQLKEKKGCPE